MIVTLASLLQQTECLALHTRRAKTWYQATRFPILIYIIEMWLRLTAGLRPIPLFLNSVYSAVRIARFKELKNLSRASNTDLLLWRRFPSLNDFGSSVYVSRAASGYSICLPHIRKPLSQQIQSSCSYLPLLWLYASMQEERVPPAMQRTTSW